MNNSSPVGFFDSGIGGVSILQAFKHIMPDESTVYIADTPNCPYGNKRAEEIISLSVANTRELTGKYGCKMIVVACNTATAAAIDYLRAKYSPLPFIGLEPAVKPAVHETRSGVVGVLATAGTFSGRLYRETKAKFGGDTTIIATVADEFVTLAEKIYRGALEEDSTEVIEAVKNRLAPLLAAGADRIVLGCTHFPHLKKAMEVICGDKAKIIDPSFAVARQARRVLRSLSLQAPAGALATHVFIDRAKV